MTIGDLKKLIETIPDDAKIEYINLHDDYKDKFLFAEVIDIKASVRIDGKDKAAYCEFNVFTD